MARARLGIRRINPRSSSAVMSRWIPDLDRRSSASFISSNDGGTPVSLSRSWMKRRSSNCLRVNIARPHVGLPQQRKTNHERTLSVPYVFRNPLISREEARQAAYRGRSERNADDRTGAPRLRRFSVRLSDQKTIRSGQGRDHGAVLGPERGRNE